MAYTIEVNSVEVSKPTLLKTSASLDQWAGKFELSFRDTAETFSIGNGNEVVVKDAGTTVFGGYVQKWSRRNGTITASGLDYTSKLAKVYVNEVYHNELVHTIVLDLIAKYAPGITTTNVYVSTTTVGEARLKNVQLFKALQELSKYDACSFFIDKSKDLHFDVLGTVDSGIDLVKGTNILSDDYEYIDDKMVNQVKITGGREDYTTTESFSPALNDTYVTLTYKPVRTKVLINDVEKIGWKEGMKSEADYDFYSDKEAKKIYFNVAFAGTEAVDVEYDYTAPIIVSKRDNASIGSYDKYEKVVYDETINKREDAIVLALQMLTDYSEPIQTGTVTTRLNLTAEVGETTDVTNASKGASGTFVIVGMDNSFFSGGRTTTYKLATLTEGVLEMLAEMVQRIEALEETNRGDSGITTYSEDCTDSATGNDDPANNLAIYKRTVNTTNSWYFGVPETFDGVLKFGGGSSVYGSNQVTSPSS
jgi:hypothetical protein